jgi:hypothetical protein
MPVDTNIYLPPSASLNDVVTVMGIAAGLPWEWHDLADGGRFVAVPGAEAKSTSMPHMAEIVLGGYRMVDDETEHLCTWHWEPDTGPGQEGRLVMCRSTAFWICVARRLVDFFGGWVDYLDEDETEVDYSRPPRLWAVNRPPGDRAQEWNFFQDRLAAVKPITVQELRDADQYAFVRMDEIEADAGSEVAAGVKNVQAVSLPVPVVPQKPVRKKKPTSPNIESAADTARAISRILRKAGFKMSVRTDRHRWTEGLYVNRVGCSCEVALDYSYSSTGGALPRNDEERQRRRDEVQRARDFLRERGYVFGGDGIPEGWIRCKRP